MNKAKKTYLILLYSVTLVAILVGIAIHMGGFFGIFFTSDNSKTENYRPSNKISSISIDADVADVTVYPGDKFEVTTDYPEEYMPHVWDENGVLYITQKMENSVKKGTYKIRITIPSNNKTDLIIVDNLGDVKVRDISFNTAAITLNLGDIEIDSVSGDTMKLTSNMGDTVVSGCDLDIVTVAGNMGDIKIDGDFGVVTARTDMGDIKINTKRPETENSIQADTNLGSVKINGKKR